MLKRMLPVAMALTLCTTGWSQELKSQRGIFGAGQPGEVSVVRMEAKKLGIKNFTMQSRQVDGRLAIDAFTGNLGSGVLQGQGLVDWSKPEDQQHLTIQVQNVETMALLKAFSVKLDAQVNAMANGVIGVQWRGVRGTTPRQTMNGTVKLQFGPGTITGAEVLQQVAAYTGIPAVQQFDFDSGEIDGTIRDGMMSITKAELTGRTKAVRGTGLMDLRTEEIRIRFDGYVSPQLIATSTIAQVRALGKLANGVGGGNLVKVPLPIIMSGAVRDPQFALRWETGDKAEAK